MKIQESKRAPRKLRSELMMKPPYERGRLKADLGDSNSEKSIPILTNVAYQWEFGNLGSIVVFSFKGSSWREYCVLMLTWEMVVLRFCSLIHTLSETVNNSALSWSLSLSAVCEIKYLERQGYFYIIFFGQILEECQAQFHVY